MNAVKAPAPIKGGTGIKCRRCGQKNLGIDIWCSRCGSHLDYYGEPIRRPRQPHRSVKLPQFSIPKVSLPHFQLPEVHLTHPAEDVRQRSVTSAEHARPALEPVAEPKARPVIVTSPEQPVFCANCGSRNEAGTPYCSRCGRSLLAAPAKNFDLPRLPKLPALHVNTSDLRLEALPQIAGLVVITLALLLLVPIVYALASSGHKTASHPLTVQKKAAASSKPTPVTDPAILAAIDGLQKQTGMRYAATSCPAGSCLTHPVITAGNNAEEVVFSVTGAPSRSCAAYLFRDQSGWHFLDSSCPASGQAAPVVGQADAVRVGVGCVNVRSAAGTASAVVGCLYNGAQVLIDGGPDYASGKLWWHLQGRGWMAHDFLLTS